MFVVGRICCCDSAHDFSLLSCLGWRRSQLPAQVVVREKSWDEKNFKLLAVNTTVPITCDNILITKTVTWHDDSMILSRTWFQKRTVKSLKHPRLSWSLQDVSVEDCSCSIVYHGQSWPNNQGYFLDWNKITAKVDIEPVFLVLRVWLLLVSEWRVTK